MLSAILVRYKETSHNVICTLIGSWDNFQGVSLQTVKEKKLELFNQGQETKDCSHQPVSCLPTKS